MSRPGSRILIRSHTLTVTLPPGARITNGPTRKRGTSGSRVFSGLHEGSSTRSEVEIERPCDATSEEDRITRLPNLVFSGSNHRAPPASSAPRVWAEFSYSAYSAHAHRLIVSRLARKAWLRWPGLFAKSLANDVLGQRSQARLSPQSSCSVSVRELTLRRRS